MREAAIALGSNLSNRSNLSSLLNAGEGAGGREANLHEAVRRLGALGKVERVSSFYDTAPVGYVDQPRFLNGALLLRTELEPVELIRALLEVERAMGRVRTVAQGPRVIDLDLLLLGDEVMETEELTLPHPEMEKRRFVLEPLGEIAPGMRHPVLGLTVAEMLERVRRRETGAPAD